MRTSVMAFDKTDLFISVRSSPSPTNTLHTKLAHAAFDKPPARAVAASWELVSSQARSWVSHLFTPNALRNRDRLRAILRDQL